MPCKKSVSDKTESNKPLINVSRCTTCRIQSNMRNWRRGSRQWVNYRTTPASKSTFKSTGTKLMPHSHGTIFSECDCVFYIAWNGLYGCQWYCSDRATSISSNLIQKRSCTQKKTRTVWMGHKSLTPQWTYMLYPFYAVEKGLGSNVKKPSPYFFKKIRVHKCFCGATGSPVMDFW